MTHPVGRRVDASICEGTDRLLRQTAANPSNQLQLAGPCLTRSDTDRPGFAVSTDTPTGTPSSAANLRPFSSGLSESGQRPVESPFGTELQRVQLGTDRAAVFSTPCHRRWTISGGTGDAPRRSTRGNFCILLWHACCWFNAISASRPLVYRISAHDVFGVLASQRTCRRSPGA